MPTAISRILRRITLTIKLLYNNQASCFLVVGAGERLIFS
jgi:hypothetical protein